MNKVLFKQILFTDESELEFYLNDGWDILANSPNPFPQPYIYFTIQRFFQEKPTKEYIKDLRNKSREYKNINSVYF